LVNIVRQLFTNHGPFNLKRWFSVLSLICIGAACVVSSYLLSRFLRQQLLHRDGVVMMEFVQSVADIENAKMRAAGREPNIRDTLMQELFDHLAGAPNMLRTNIYSPDQKLAWSSEKNLIGKRFDDNHELEQALKGEMEIEIGYTSKHQHPKHEHMFLSDAPVEFVETYLPIRDRSTNRVIGVAELYRVPAALSDTVLDRKTRRRHHAQPAGAPGGGGNAGRRRRNGLGSGAWHTQPAGVDTQFGGTVR
jgi:two-component system sensor histidine kinase HydH